MKGWGLAAVLLAASATAQEPAARTHRATGTFEVKMSPETAAGKGPDGTARHSIEKVFHGGIEGTSRATMLSFMSAGVPDSGVYVALEKVTGAVNGKKGSFLLHHTGVMDHGAPNLSVRVVPDSGTGELAKVAGTLTIDIAKDGTHSYTFEYTLPEAPAK
jgi:hypothetical protein